MRQIVALGGGGFSMEPGNPLMDAYLLGLVVMVLERDAGPRRNVGDQFANRIEPLGTRGDRHPRLVLVDLGHQALPAVVTDVREIRELLDEAVSYPDYSSWDRITVGRVP